MKSMFAHGKAHLMSKFTFMTMKNKLKTFYPHVHTKETSTFVFLDQIEQQLFFD